MPIRKPGLKFLLPTIILLGGLVRLLFIFTPPMDSDQAVTGLMARHILGGEFPFFFYGQDYCGSIEAYLASIIFLFLGASRFTLDLTICLESLFLILFIYYLARQIFDETTALLSALFTALGSYYLIFHSVLARAAYIEIPIIGVLLLIVTLKIVFRQEAYKRLFFILGVLCGLGLWTHFLIVFYLPPVFLFWFIKDRWFWIRPSILFFFLGLILGGLPLWSHNIAHPLVTWHYLFDNAGSHEPALTSLKDFFLYRFPDILGIRNNGTGKFFIPYFSFFMYPAYLGSFLVLLFYRRKGFLGLGKLRLDKSDGLDLLLLFLFLFPIIFSLSGFASAHTSRYLQPLFSVLPILMAVLTIRIKSFSVALASLFLVFHLFSNVYGTMTVLPLVSKEQTGQYRQARENITNLFKFLKEKNIKLVYAPEYWHSVQLTFDAQEKIIFGQPTGDRYPLYTELIDRDDRPAFLFTGENKEFEETLINIGGTFRKSQVNRYSVYYDFSPPLSRFTELSPTGWTATADNDPTAAMAMFDRNLATRWSSSEPQPPGTFIQIDLGKIVPDLGRITLFSGNPENIPRGLQLEISLDGREWQMVSEIQGPGGFLYWSGPHPFYRPQGGRIDMTFPPCSGRFIKLTPTGKDSPYPWSVAECFIYQAHPRSEQTTDGLPALLAFLKGVPAAQIYTTPWIESHLTGNQGFKQKKSESREGLVPELSNALFVVEPENGPALANYLKKNFSIPYLERYVGSQALFIFPLANTRYLPLSNKTWHFQTNVNPSKAALVADGKINTRWTTGKPQAPGDFFQIDLGQAETIARIRLLVGDSRNDFPRGYVILYSMDGRSWKVLNGPTNPLPLFWTGETLLRGGGDLDLTFSPIPLRFLQIVQTGRDNVYYWSIHEIELYKKEGD
jgi:hypothetical protein